MADRILILGASARAAAASARRAGLTPFAVDLFADADTERICEKVWRCPPDRYPEGLFELAKHAPPMSWMYTGGVENYPELVGELSRERELWGNGPDVLAKVRDPESLASVLGNPGGLAYPRFARFGEPVPSERRWVRKPLRGSGGLGVRFAVTSDPDSFLQEFVPGEPLSAVARRDDAGITVCGVARQLVGTPWLHARPFAYAGSVGPVSLAGAAGAELRAQLFLLVRRADVRGVWGVDVVMRDGRPVLIEVNPRYPASAEVHEHATGRAILAAGLEDSTRPTKTVGKAIYHAPLSITFPASGPWDDSLARAADVWHRPDFADLPHSGDGIEPGQPVLTILADADTEAECLARLQSRAADLDRLFGFAR